MKRLLVLFLFCAVLLMGCAGTPSQIYFPQDQRYSWDLSDSGDAKVIAMYDKGYDTVDELLTDSVLVVRAMPVSVESDVAVCLVLDVEEASVAGIETIRLRQIKDEYLLEMGKEVVLALQPDAGEGYYNIPGGGCGLFRIDEETDTITGMLLDSLLEGMPAAYSANGGADLSLEDVYDLLVAKSEAAP